MFLYQFFYAMAAIRSMVVKFKPYLQQQEGMLHNSRFYSLKRFVRREDESKYQSDDTRNFVTKFLF